MKKIILIIVSIIYLTSCMNKAESTHQPEEFFQGKDLVMAQAIYDGDIQEIENLIKNKGYDVNTRGNSTRKGRIQRVTYLNYAMKVEKIKSAEKLLQLGADINLIGLDGGARWSNMNLACARKNKEMIELLLKYKVNLNNPLCGSPIGELLIGDVDKSLVELLINNGADINHQDYIDGGTPIMTALAIGKFDYVHYFLDKGADPLLLDSSGNSLAFLVQEEIGEGRLSDYGLKEYNKLKNRLINEFHVQFPIKNQYRRSLEESIKRHEGLSKENKELLGEAEVKRINKYKDCLERGVDLVGRPLE